MAPQYSRKCFIEKALRKVTYVMHGTFQCMTVEMFRKHVTLHEEKALSQKKIENALSNSKYFVRRSIMY